MFCNFSENLAIWEIISKNMVKPEMPQMAIWGRIACCFSKAKGPQSHARSRAPTPTHVQKYAVLFHVNCGIVNSSQFNVTRTFPVLHIYAFSFRR
jgi:hypothetical protein